VAPPQIPRGSSQRSRSTPSLDLRGPTSKSREWKDRGRREEGREGRKGRREGKEARGREGKVSPMVVSISLVSTARHL